MAERAAGEPDEGVVVDVGERVGRPQRQRGLGAPQRGAVGAQLGRAGERQPVEQAGQRVGQHVDRDRDRQAGEQQHGQRGLLAPSAPCRSAPGRRTARPPRPSPTNERSMSARSAWPSSNASHIATATPSSSDVETRGRQRQPAGHQAERNDQDRVAQREEQRGDHEVAHHRPRLPRAATPPAPSRPASTARSPRTSPSGPAAAGRRRCRPSPRRTRQPPPTTATSSSSPARLRQCRAAATARAAPRTRPCRARRPDRSRRWLSSACTTADDPHRVQRHHRREARQSDRGQREHRLARITGQQVQAQPPAQREHHRRQRSHDSSVARARPELSYLP